MYKELKNYNIIGTERKNFIYKISNIHINSIYNWIKNTNVVEIKRKDYKNKKITNTIEQYIIYKIKTNPIISAKTLKNNIKTEFNISLSISSIYYVIKNNNITYKKLNIKTNPHNNITQKEQLKYMDSIIKSVGNDNIISIDETSIELSSKPSKGWSKKGEKCNIDINKAKINNKRYTVVMAISNKEILDFSIVEKGMKGSGFLNFIKKLKRKDVKNDKTYLMDNAVIHKTKLFYNYAKEEKINVLYNVPYHSETNPIETIFSILKNKINRCVNDTREDIIKILVEFKKTYKKSLNKIYNNSGCFLKTPAFSLYLNNKL
jgi:transposase